MSSTVPTCTLRFVKMSGAGNDFVVVDNRDGVVHESDKSALARRACRRKIGVGADGLILIEPAGAREAATGADYVMRYFNADGSEGELCGNGTRCAAVFAGRSAPRARRKRLRRRLVFSRPRSFLAGQTRPPRSGW